ncbi:MAG TPA: D-alanyl-D-alanine carboxypeptidase, partial [bacterium]|nr:D-alanyl-D-alanine carboxypeptidase [bacterium]
MASTGIVVNYPSSGKILKLPKVPASAYVIADANTGQVLAAKDPHGQFAPASTLKMLTAVTLIPALNPNAMVKTTRFAADQEPNDVGLVRGRKYQVANLFRALLLISANDAAVALTQATGSFSKGMAMINAEAHHLQAYDVVAKLPNGLPAKGQVVSAYDEALIARQALSIPAFMHYDSTLAARFEVNDVKKKHETKKKKQWVTLVNQNYLLTQYRGGIGGKIGWTEKSEATYIGLARRNGVTLIVTVLHCTPLKEITAGEKLLNWGFHMAGQVKPVGTLVPPLPSAATVRKEQQAKAAAQAARARRHAARQHAQGAHRGDADPGPQPQRHGESQPVRRRPGAQRRRARPRPQVPGGQPVPGPAADLGQRRRGRAHPGHRLVQQGHGHDQRRGPPPPGLRRGGQA